MDDKIKIKINANGQIEAKICGENDRRNKNYIKFLEDILSAEIIDSEYVNEQDKVE